MSANLASIICRYKHVIIASPTTMKTVFAILCFSLLTAPSFSQNESQKLDSVRSQIKREQYLTAYRTIQTIQQPSPDLILLTADLLLDHYSEAYKSYDMWTLENKIADQNGKRERIGLDLEGVIWQFIKLYPAECRIYAAQSRLYVKMFQIEDQYIPLEDLKSIADIVEKNIQTKCPDHYSNYILGYCNNYLGQPQKSIDYLQKSIVYHTRYLPAYLELANAYLRTGDYSNVLKNASKAFDLATKNYDKSKAALYMAQAYEAQKDNQKALSSYLLADSLYRRDFFIQKALLAFYVKTGNSKSDEAMNAFTGGQDRGNLHNYLDAFQIYSTANRQNDLAIFCQKGLETYKGRSDVEACLNFTLGKIYKTINATMAKQYFKNAKDLGMKADRYPATRNHPVTGKEVDEAFKTIN